MIDFPRCKGWSRQKGRPCMRPPIPFGDYCIVHGGNTSFQREKARKAMLEYQMWSTDPPWLVNKRVRQWQESDDRWQMRKAKKKGPQAVANLQAHLDAEAATKKAWREDSKRARLEQREREKQQWREQHPKPRPAPPLLRDDEPPTGGFDPWEGSMDMDWDL